MPKVTQVHDRSDRSTALENVAHLNRRLLRLRNTLWAKTGARTASPPTQVRFQFLPTEAPMDSQRWLRLVEEVPSGALLHLEGPELFQDESVHAILMAADRRELEISVSVDAALLEEHAPELYGLGVSQVRIVLYGPEAVHNELAGSAWAFERAARGALALKGLAYGSSTPELVVEIPILPANASLLLNTAECAFAMGADRVVILHVAAGRDSSAGAIDPDVVNSQALSISARWKRGSVRFSPAFESELVRRLYNGGPEAVVRRRCIAPWKSVTVTSDGKVLLCDVSIGDAKEASLTTLYNSDSARAFRHGMRKRRGELCKGCLASFSQRRLP